MNALPFELRTSPRDSDRWAIRQLVAATGFFHAEEIDIAEELIDERLRRGETSGYHFVFADDEAGLAGYTCYGPIAGTKSSYDLYWIAVDPDRHRRGIGRRLMEETESRMRQAGGTRAYVDTSNRPQYEPTRTFYLRCGYKIAAILNEFYGPGDDKVIFEKRL